jgi:hypothetical protein
MSEEELIEQDSDAEAEVDELLEKIYEHDAAKLPGFARATLIWELAGGSASCRLCAASGRRFVCDRQSSVLMRWHEGEHARADARFNELMNER